MIALVLAGGIYFLLKPIGKGAGTQTASSQKSGERKILFYRNPMNPAITSSAPAKDEMGMDYIPVYEDEGNAPKKTMAQEVDDFFSDQGTGAGQGGVAGLAPITLTQAGIEAAGVLTAPVTLENFEQQIRTVGRVMADETRVRKVPTRVSGWVEKVHVRSAGQMVQQGEPIIALYSPELLSSQEEYIQALAMAEKMAASSDPETRKSGEELRHSAGQRLKLFDVPEAFVAELQKKRKPRRAVTLTAPISGFVMVKEVLEGQKVEPGMIFFVISDLSHIWVEADFYEYEGKGLKPGQEAVVSSAYDPALEMKGKVALVYPYLNPESRTIKARLEFANSDLKLKPDMYVDVSLRLDHGRSVQVPESAVLDSGPRKVVFVYLGNGRFEPREVRAGARSHGQIQILEGVAQGEHVAVKANFLLDSESRLQALIQGAMKKR